MGHGASNWQEVVDNAGLRAQTRDRSGLLANLGKFGALATPSIRTAPPTANGALLTRLLELCPCLYNQTNIRCSPAGVVHLCEVTLGVPITSANVAAAFDIQHPSRGPAFAFEQ